MGRKSKRSLTIKTFSLNIAGFRSNIAKAKMMMKTMLDLHQKPFASSGHVKISKINSIRNPIMELCATSSGKSLRNRRSLAEKTRQPRACNFRQRGVARSQRSRPTTQKRRKPYWSRTDSEVVWILKSHEKRMEKRIGSYGEDSGWQGLVYKPQESLKKL